MTSPIYAMPYILRLVTAAALRCALCWVRVGRWRGFGNGRFSRNEASLLLAVNFACVRPSDAPTHAPEERVVLHNNNNNKVITVRHLLRLTCLLFPLRFSLACPSVFRRVIVLRILLIFIFCFVLVQWNSFGGSERKFQPPS